MEVRDECADFMGSLLGVKVLNLFHQLEPNMMGSQRKTCKAAITT